MSLSTALWRPTSSRDSIRRALAVEQGCGVQAACLLEDPLRALRSASGNETMTERATTGPETIIGQLTSTWSREAFPQIPQLEEAKKCRSAKSAVKGTVRSTVTTL